MQPLSKVKPGASIRTLWGAPVDFASRPAVSVKIVECIAAWSQIELSLGVFLSMVLHSSQDAVAAMFASIENRTARLRMIEAAAKSSLPQAHFEIIDALFASQIKPAMKERDKLAHWYWGVADDLPDALLLADPSHHLFV